MKTKFFMGFLILAILLPSCKNAPIRPAYRPIMPELPDHWQKILGEARWRLEWINESGSWQEWEGVNMPELPLMQEWANPVLAWPFWPEMDLIPGMIRPSGALFPWDVHEETLLLSWKGGVDAIFWKELALADRTSMVSKENLPWYFDWSRFRELFESDNIPMSVKKDPWLADWRDIAQRTVLSGFDRRRIVSRPSVELLIPGLGGLWAGSSPFASPLEAAPEGPLKLNVWDIPDTWVSAEATIRCSNAGYVFIKRH